MEASRYTVTENDLAELYRRAGAFDPHSARAVRTVRGVAVTVTRLVDESNNLATIWVGEEPPPFD
ncbi:hypothetical protein [Deinococcus aluminii]